MLEKVTAPEQPGRTFNERLLLVILAAIQFTAIVDFLIILPLGPQYMRVFNINPGQFGVIVSAYAISAGVSGVLTGFILDRFDRKRALLVLYFGFSTGTLLCALAPTFHLLVAARIVAGAFGGVAGALILAIIGDVIPEQRRGAAMGLVMSSFSVASICGVPLGLILANSLNWHLPFFVLAGLSYVVLAASAWILPPLRGHMLHLKDQHPVARMMAVLSHTDHQMAFLFMALLSVTGFIIFPNIANYMVWNVGLTEKQLPLIYLAGGLATVFSMNWIGRWADRSGKLRVFTLMSLMATIPILLVTNLPRASVVVAVATSTLLMVCMSGRMVPAMALMTASIETQYRGGFMSINSAVQQFSCGVAAYVSGQILTQTATGELAHFPVLGIGSIVCALICIYLARFLKMPEGSQPAMQGLPAEG